MNRLTRSLAHACKENRIGEKWLVAPNYRTGNQWLESVARAGTPVVNVRVKTLRAMAILLASPEMARRKVELLHHEAGPILIDRAWARVAAAADPADQGYLARLAPGPSLARTFLATINDLRLAGLAPERLDPARFEVSAKGIEIVRLLEAWEKILADCGFVDYAEVLTMAAARLKRDPSCLPGDLTLLLPDDADPNKLERDLLAVIRDTLGDRIRPLAIDEPAATPPPRDDGTVCIVRAVGEVNEVREALRACLAGGISLDEVELLHTDTETYIPHVYETFARLAGDAPGDDAPGADDLDGMPVTFAEGVPARYSRPGRALAGLISWARDGFRQETLARLIQDGILKIPAPNDTTNDATNDTPPEKTPPAYTETERESYAALARVFRSIPIVLGAERYGPRLAAAGGLDRDTLRTLRTLRPLVKELLALAPRRGEPQKITLDKALRFLEERVRCVTRLDNLALDRLTSRVRRLARLVAEEETTGIDIVRWLADLPRDLRVGGSGPRPGKLHVAAIPAGGHSGRPHTILVGLDDGRFPGGAGQDPLLLDGEREEVSNHLPTSRSRIEKKTEAFERLLARLRGRVTLSFTCHDVVEDREVFPSPMIGQACRLLTGNRDAGIAAFAPDNPAKCLDEAECWLHHLCAPGPVTLPENELAGAFPWIGRGLRAAGERGSKLFTPFDGRVGKVASEDDPFAPEGPAMSSTGLEQIAACPRRYFFARVLRIAPPDEIEPDLERWLNAAQRGSLLHDVFHLFWHDLLERGETPSVSAHTERLRAIVRQKIEAERALNPPGNEIVFKKEMREIEKTVRIFLQEEETYAAERNVRPCCLEAAIGLPPSDPPSPIDRPEPVPITLAPGKTIRVRGRIDRIDRADDGEEFTIWDYKTGSAAFYERLDKKNRLGDRVIQNGLYLSMAQAVLREKVAKNAHAAEFGFFFPGPRERGKRLAWPAKKLTAWKSKAAALCGVVSAGCFLATDNALRDVDDCRFCNYTAICGDLAALHARSASKIGNSDEPALAPIREVKNDE